MTRATKRVEAAVVETVPAEPKTEKKPKKEKAPAPDSLEGIRLRIRNRYERPTVVYETDTVKVPIYPTRFPELNAMCGGGIPGGSVIEIFGPEDSCKTSFALALAADIQAAAPPEKDHVVFNNYERRQPWRWWQKLGLKTDEKRLTHMLPTSLEEGIGDSLALVETKRVCAVLIDSVFAAGSREGKDAVLAWSDPKAKKASLGVEARKWGEAWTAFVPVLQSTDTVAIAINQIRDMIDVGGMARPRPGMEKPTTTPRGRALKFYAWMRLETRARNLDPNEYPDVDGRHVKVKCIKNGFSEGARARFELDMIRGEGFDVTGSLVKVALEAGLIDASGSWYSVQGKRVANGKARLRQRVAEHADLRGWLEREVQKFLSAQPDDAAREPQGEEENGGEDTPVGAEPQED